MNAKLLAIANEAAENLKDLVRNHEEKILEAWNAAEQEAQDNETKPKFRLALAITLDLDADTMETALSFGIRYKASRDQQIPDPAQTNLPLDNSNDLAGEPKFTSVTIGPTEAAMLSKAARKLAGK